MNLPQEFTELLDACAELIDSSGLLEPHQRLPSAEPLSSLLERCERLTERVPDGPEPIRTVHHFACTGGTLIAKCLACVPNTQLLSEVEPFSPIPDPAHRFHPSDLILQLRYGSRGADAAVERKLFLAGLGALYTDCQEKGLRLVLRDHTHSRYCVGSEVADTPSLRELAESVAPLRAIVTVRHPLDSFLSVRGLGWLHFEPATLDEYCRRYLRFLDDYEALPRFKYEEFVAAPDAQLRVMCDALALPSAEGFEQLFSVHRLSGDSGRSAGVISPRERRPVPEPLEAETVESASYGALCERLGYEI